MGETWKDIKGYEGLYQVSNFGRLKTLHYKGSNKEKILKYGKSSNGYLLATLYKEKHKKVYKIHRLVAKAFISNPENKPQVNHIDGCKQNNNVLNLEWVTCKENIEHSFRTGLQGKYKSAKPNANRQRNNTKMETRAK